VKQAIISRIKHLQFLQNIGYEYCENWNIPKHQDILITSNSLEELEKEVQNCHLCNISKYRKHTVFAEGDKNAKLMIIGEAPGAKEDELGRPFVGRAGELLSAMIEKGIGIKRESVYIANIIKCRPPNNRNPQINEIENCMGYLQKQIELVKPKIILALGNVSFQNLTGLDVGITKARGKIYDYHGTTLIASFHPSYLLRNPSAKKDSFADLIKVKNLLQKV